MRFTDFRSYYSLIYTVDRPITRTFSPSMCVCVSVSNWQPTDKSFEHQQSAGNVIVKFADDTYVVVYVSHKLGQYYKRTDADTGMGREQLLLVVVVVVKINVA